MSALLLPVRQLMLSTCSAAKVMYNATRRRQPSTSSRFVPHHTNVSYEELNLVEVLVRPTLLTIRQARIKMHILPISLQLIQQQF